MFEKLYDLLVSLTENYSELPDSIKKKWPEYKLVHIRQFLFTDLYDNELC